MRLRPTSGRTSGWFVKAVVSMSPRCNPNFIINVRSVARAILLLGLAVRQSLLAPVHARAATTTGDPCLSPAQ